MPPVACENACRPRTSAKNILARRSPGGVTRLLVLRSRARGNVTGSVVTAQKKRLLRVCSAAVQPGVISRCEAVGPSSALTPAPIDQHSGHRKLPTQAACRSDRPIRPPVVRTLPHPESGPGDRGSAVRRLPVLNKSLKNMNFKENGMRGAGSGCCAVLPSRTPPTKVP